jgi:hypothetical protein
MSSKSISRRYIAAFNTQDRIRCAFSHCGSLVFAGSEDRQVHCWQTYNGNLLYSYQSLNYTQSVVDLHFHPFDNLIAMCSMGPSHQVHVFQHISNVADQHAQPFTSNRDGHKSLSTVMTSMALSESEQRPPISSARRFESSVMSKDTSENELDTGRSYLNNATDQSFRSDTMNDRKNRRLAVVNKILDDMEDVIVS